MIELCQRAYVDNIFGKLIMDNFKKSFHPIYCDISLSKKQCQMKYVELKRMKRISCALAFESIMYGTYLTRILLCFEYDEKKLVVPL